MVQPPSSKVFLLNNFPLTTFLCRSESLLQAIVSESSLTKHSLLFCGYFSVSHSTIFLAILRRKGNKRKGSLESWRRQGGWSGKVNRLFLVERKACKRAQRPDTAHMGWRRHLAQGCRREVCRSQRALRTTIRGSLLWVMRKLGRVLTRRMSGSDSEKSTWQPMWDLGLAKSRQRSFRGSVVVIQWERMRAWTK